MGSAARTAGPSTALRFAQDDSQFGVWTGRAQGRLGGVVKGVQVAELEGHMSRSAVYLIHIEVRTGACAATSKMRPPGVYR